MLKNIRDNLSKWVTGVLLFLVAIPLVFMGLGDYRTSSESYAFKIDDKTVSTSRLEQEIFQYKQALLRNNNNQIPPIYTDDFIKDVTINYMIRTMLIDDKARELSLVFHNDSVISTIKNTSAFRNERGFDDNLYLSQLYRINMSPESYESYVYQTGVTDQLKKSITETSFITNAERDLLTRYRFHTRNVNFKIISKDKIKNKISISANEISEYYQNNLDDFKTPKAATFNYIDIDKSDLINNQTISEIRLKEIYQEKLDDGDFLDPIKYTIEHILIPIGDDMDLIAKDLKKELDEGATFESVIKKYKVDEETKQNKGSLGTFEMNDLPEYFVNTINSLPDNVVSSPIISDRGTHFLRIKNRTNKKIMQYGEVKSEILTNLKNEKGTRLYFDLIDQIGELSFSKSYTLNEIADDTQQKIITSRKISVNEGYGIFNYDNIREIIFDDDIIINEKVSDLIYINENRFIVVEKNEFYKPSQMSLNDSADIIKSLLLELETNNKIQKISENTLVDLNSNTASEDESFENFSGNIDNTNINPELVKIFFEADGSLGYQQQTLGSDRVIFRINEIDFNNDIKADDLDDFLNFASNTRSETEFYQLFLDLRNNSEIIVNE